MFICAAICVYTPVFRYITDNISCIHVHLCMYAFYGSHKSFLYAVSRIELHLRHASEGKRVLWHFFTLIYIMASQKRHVPLPGARSIKVAVPSIARPEKKSCVFHPSQNGRAGGREPKKKKASLTQDSRHPNTATLVLLHTRVHTPFKEPPIEGAKCCL